MAEQYRNELADKAEKPDSELTLEEAFAQTEELIRKLEEENLPLEEAFALYERGMALLRQCSGQIDRVEKQMITLRTASDAAGQE